MSNTIGSNVFDILVGLGVPWALQTMCVDYGSVVRSQSCPLFITSASEPSLTLDLVSGLVAGDDKQSRPVVLGGAPAGLRGPHGEQHFTGVETIMRKTFSTVIFC